MEFREGKLVGMVLAGIKEVLRAEIEEVLEEPMREK